MGDSDWGNAGYPKYIRNVGISYEFIARKKNKSQEIKKPY
jgi:hypothetical protein